MWSWVQGKKTYILAAAVVLLLVLLVGGGMLTPGLAIDILVFSAPCFAATFRSAIGKNHSELLAALTEVAKLGADVRSHHCEAAQQDAVQIVEIAGPVLVDQMKSTGILRDGYPLAAKETN